MSAATTSLERNVGGKDQWRPAAHVRYVSYGSQLMIAVPRAALGLTRLPAAIDFKWADHCHVARELTLTKKDCKPLSPDILIKFSMRSGSALENNAVTCRQYLKRAV